MNLNKFKKIFLEQKQTIIDSLNATSVEVDPDGDEYDSASAESIGSMQESLSKRLIKKLADINLALKKIDEGVFGVCEECGQAISEKRLIAKPDATLCITCAENIEKNNKQFARK